MGLLLAVKKQLGYQTTGDGKLGGAWVQGYTRPLCWIERQTVPCTILPLLSYAIKNSKQTVYHSNLIVNL